MSNAKVYGEVSPGVYKIVKVDADGKLFLEPSSIGGGGGGGLTDLELRATPVPVGLDATSLSALETVGLSAETLAALESITAVIQDGGGSITVDGPLTDAQLRATPVPVSGDFGSPGLTDAELRASAVPVSDDTPVLEATGTILAQNDAVTLTGIDGYTEVLAYWNPVTAANASLYEVSADGINWFSAIWTSIANAQTFPTNGQFSLFGFDRHQINVTGATAVRARQFGAGVSNATVLLRALKRSTPRTTSFVQIHNGSNPIGHSSNEGDGQSNATDRLRVVNAPVGYNESTWDRQRNNTDVSAIASAARTVATNTADLVNFNGRTVVVVINVTVAGTGGLTPTIKGKALIPATYYALGAAFTKIIATGLYVYVIGRDAPATVAGGITASLIAPVPRTWRLEIGVDDGSSWTYSVSVGTLV